MDICKCCGSSKNLIYGSAYTGTLCEDCYWVMYNQISDIRKHYSFIESQLMNVGLLRRFVEGIRVGLNAHKRVELLEAEFNTEVNNESIRLKYRMNNSDYVTNPCNNFIVKEFSWSIKDKDHLIVTQLFNSHKRVLKKDGNTRTDVIIDEPCDNSQNPNFKFDWGFRRYKNTEKIYNVKGVNYLVNKKYIARCQCCGNNEQIVYNHYLTGPLCKSCLEGLPYRNIVDNFEYRFLPKVTDIAVIEELKVVTDGIFTCTEMGKLVGVTRVENDIPVFIYHLITERGTHCVAKLRVCLSDKNDQYIKVEYKYPNSILVQKYSKDGTIKILKSKDVDNSKSEDFDMFGRFNIMRDKKYSKWEHR